MSRSGEGNESYGQSMRSTAMSTIRALLVVMLLPAVFVVFGTGTAQAAELNAGCSYDTQYVSNIAVGDDGIYGTRISVTPTDAARLGGGPGSPLTDLIWPEIQSCVPNLYGSVADSIFQQLQCHVLFSEAPAPELPLRYASGNTWDFDTAFVPLSSPNPVSYYSSKCLNSQPVVIGDPSNIA